LQRSAHAVALIRLTTMRHAGGIAPMAMADAGTVSANSHLPAVISRGSGARELRELEGVRREVPIRAHAIYRGSPRFPRGLSRKNFAAAGVAGYVAPRHLRAVAQTGNRLIAALDPRDSVGVLDQFSPDVQFFTEPERFERHLEKRKRGPASDHLNFL